MHMCAHIRTYVRTLYEYLHLVSVCVCVRTYVGANWLKACQEKCSPYHIVPSTGMELTLQRSILKKDAFLPRYSTHIHGTTLQGYWYMLKDIISMCIVS